MIITRTIDAWTTNINGKECQFQIIQHEGANDFIMERVLGDLDHQSHSVATQPTRTEVEQYFSKSVFGI
jgi:hypothetical protein